MMQMSGIRCMQTIILDKNSPLTYEVYTVRIRYGNFNFIQED